MHVVVLGAGIIGTSTAWHLMQRGYHVTLVDRQPDAGLETSYANAAQISVGHCEPWASRSVPLQALRWLLDKQAPLLLRPQWDAAQWSWLLRFLGQCHDKAFARNLAQIVALGCYSHAALKDLLAQTGIEYPRSQRGIVHYYTERQAFDAAAQQAQMMACHGVERRVVERAELLGIEPALRAYADRIVGGTFTPSDEHGDAQVFTQKLAALCVDGGVTALFSHQVDQIALEGAAIRRVVAHHQETGVTHVLEADAVVVACGSYTRALLQQVGVRVPIYPCKGYSATLRLLDPARAPQVSLIDDARKVAVSRLGDRLRVAGTIELGGFDLALDTPLARERCALLTRRVEEVFPGVADTRLPDEGGAPQFWCGLRPGTPTNIPLIGRTPVPGLWINAGHGTLGWTHGAGSGRALADLMCGHRPPVAMRFAGESEAEFLHYLNLRARSRAT